MDFNELVRLRSVDMSEDLKFKLLEISRSSTWMEDVLNLLIELEIEENLIDDQLSDDLDKISEVSKLIKDTLTTSDLYNIAQNLKELREQKGYNERVNKELVEAKEKIKSIEKSSEEKLQKLESESKQKIENLTEKLKGTEKEVVRLKEELEKKLNRYQILKIQNGKTP